jgi:hypothetical protein
MGSSPSKPDIEKYPFFNSLDKIVGFLKDLATQDCVTMVKSYSNDKLPDDFGVNCDVDGIRMALGVAREHFSDGFTIGKGNEVFDFIVENKQFTLLAIFIKFYAMKFDRVPSRQRWLHVEDKIVEHYKNHANGQARYIPMVKTYSQLSAYLKRIDATFPNFHIDADLYKN